ncbi:diguanylate cyclase (GGDEF) domain-containing protein [Rhizobium miluonense]|uniref:diguanylate cyclase n=1 Tax=Rhizobium miluonense TaxID=411945 RepID=A0A1C3VGI4_9HYPH|nr:diguanylate cyclase (GGDEF) domain-containing protein [Rhizobium miluonense]
MDAVTLEEVDRQIRNGFRFLRFKPAIEKLFLQDYAANRVRLAPIWAVVGTLIYDLVYFGDRTMMADVFSQLVLVRFGIFTPFALFSVIALRRWRSALNYDLLAICVAVLGVSLPMSVAMHSGSPYLFVYQNGNVAAFLFFVIALSPRFATILIGLVLMCAVQFTTTKLSGAFDDIVYTGIITFYVTLTIFLVLSAYFTEHKDRLNFLNQLRGTLLHTQLEQKSERDELTGLFNRHSLDRVRSSIWRANGEVASVAVIMLDIDRFKLFNDVHGHVEGDECIRAVCQCISREIGANGTSFRFGGEEILVLLPDTNCEVAFAIAERTRRSIEALGIRHRGLDGHVTASLGVTCGKPSQASLEDLLKTADAALYEAKRVGRNTVTVGRAAMRQLQ